MLKKEILNNIIFLINEIAKDMENGDQIIRDECAKNLLWMWTNSRTRKNWIIRLSEINKLDYQDILYITIIEFVKGWKSALETRKYIEKLPKLKAFL